MTHNINNTRLYVIDLSIASYDHQYVVRATSREHAMTLLLPQHLSCDVTALDDYDDIETICETVSPDTDFATIYENEH